MSHRSVDYTKKLLPQYLLRGILRREQRKIYRRFEGFFPPNPGWTVLDVGTNGSLTDAKDYFLHNLYPYRQQITACGLEEPDRFKQVFPECAYVQVERGEGLPFEEQSFDLVFCNAVVEHVGSREVQREFVRELLRVGRNVFMTTPNRWHPIEFHTTTVLLHYLPAPVYRRVFRAMGMEFFSKEENLNLLDERTVRSLVPAQASPNLEIGFHQFLCFRSNILVAVRREKV